MDNSERQPRFKRASDVRAFLRFSREISTHQGKAGALPDLTRSYQYLELWLPKVRTGVMNTCKVHRVSLEGEREGVREEGRKGRREREGGGLAQRIASCNATKYACTEGNVYKSKSK